MSWLLSDNEEQIVFAPKKQGRNAITDIVSHVKTGDDIQEITPENIDNNTGSILVEPMDNYLSTKAISSGYFKHDTALDLLAYIEAPQKTGKHLEFGTNVHTLILEPHLLNKVIEVPNVNLATKDGVNQLLSVYRNRFGIFYEALTDGIKLLDNTVSEYIKIQNINLDDLVKYETLKNDTVKISQILANLKYEIAIYESYAKAMGYIILDADSKTALAKLKNNVDRYGNGIIKRLLQGALIETSFYNEIDGLGLCKCRPDAVNFVENIGVNALISVKTTRNTNIKMYESDAAKMGYLVADAYYLDLINRTSNREFDTVINIVIQNCEPYQVAVLVYPDELLQAAKYRYETYKEKTIGFIEEIKNMQPSGWEIFAQDGDMGLIEMNAPNWVFSEIQASL